MIRRSHWQFLAGIGVVAASITAAAPAASAQSTAPTSIMRACWVEGSGVLYRRDTTNAPTGCQQSTHRAIEWTLGLIPIPQGGLTAVPVPLMLAGASDVGPILNLQNTGTGQALLAQSSGTSATALFQRSTGTGHTVRMVNSATGDGFGHVLRVEQSANASAANITSTGTGSALFAQNSAQAPTVGVSNNSTTTGSAVFAESKGQWPTGDFRNTGSANGAALNARSAGGNTTATIISEGTAGANALYAESKGQWTTADFRNTGTANGGALYAESKGQWTTADLRNTGTANGGALRASSNTTGGTTTASILNDNATSTGGGALYAESKGNNFTISANNSGLDGSALGAFSNSSFTTANIGSNNTGAGRAIWAESKGSSPTITARNSGTANGAAIQGMSQGEFYTGDFRNTGSGGSVYALSQGSSNTIIASNTSASGGGAAYFDNQSPTMSTLSIEAKGGASAIYSRSSGQNGVFFENVGTGNNIGILGRSRGVWPTAQFENIGGGPALYAIGRAQIDGNLQINGNYAATGTKNAVVPTSSGTREMYTEEATEVWFADYGQATIADSVVWVPFDGTFAETIETDLPYHVFLQAYADASIYVSRRTADGFEVRIAGARPSAQPIEFSYRLVAKRRGYGDRRLRAHPIGAVTLTDKNGAGK